MKKLLIYGVCAAMVLSLAACSGGKSVETEETKEETTINFPKTEPIYTKPKETTKPKVTTKPKETKKISEDEPEPIVETVAVRESIGQKNALNKAKDYILMKKQHTERKIAGLTG